MISAAVERGPYRTLVSDHAALEQGVATGNNMKLFSNTGSTFRRWSGLNAGRSLARCLLGLLMLGGLTGAVAETPGVKSEPGPGTYRYLVGFAQDTLANDWRLAQVQEVKRGLASDPSIRFLVTDGQGQTARQIMDIEDMIAQKVDVLITSPRDAQALAPVVTKAYRAGIPVVLLSRRIAGEAFNVFIAPDNRQIGRRVARYLGKNFPQGGRILMLKGVSKATTTILRTEGFVEELKHYPGLELVAERTANYLRGDAIKAVEDVLDGGIRFDMIYAQSDSMAVGARLALKHAGIDPGTITIVGIDYIREAQSAILSGEQEASFTYPTGGKEGAEYVLRILRGETVPRKILINSEMVNIDNAKTLEPIF